MPSIKDLKTRISSVKNTQQTTRAMKMVSAAKLRRAQDAIQSHRPYARRIGELIQLLYSLQTETVASPLFRTREALAAEREHGGPRKLLLVLCTSDRGLCGGFNSNINKGAQRWIAAHKAEYGEIQLAFVGRKGHDFFKVRQSSLGPYFAEVTGKMTFAKARHLSDALVELFVSGQYDEIKFVYNEFKNAVTQVVQVETFLPLMEPAPSGNNEQTLELPNYIVKPDAQTLLNQLIAKNFPVQAFRVLLDSQASEHGARMSSMENATKNAGEMIRKLTLQYNKQRQAGITKELLEIISGSESQKG
jgi:F-type H+-transporting ATPase subunit gamma